MKGVPITLDKERRIHFTMESWHYMHREMDPTIVEDVVAAFNRRPEDYDFQATLGLMAAMTDLLWLGLLHEDDTLTLKQVARMVDADNYEHVMGALGKAFANAFPEGAAAENPTKPDPSIGSRSPASVSAG